MRFFFFYVDPFSFWTGFVFSGLVWVIITILRPSIKQLRVTLTNKIKLHSQKTSEEIEFEYFSNLQIKINGMHLAASIFPFDDIQIEPRILFPPIRPFSEEAQISDSSIYGIFPYNPMCPEFSAAFGLPTLPLSIILESNSSFSIVGKPGSGKTFSLAYLASLLSKKYFSQKSKNSLVPFLLHFTDFSRFSSNDLCELLVKKASQFLPSNKGSLVTSFVKDLLDDNRLLLLVDGFDDYSLDCYSKSIEILKDIQDKYPNTRIITTAIPENLKDVYSLNLIQIVLSPWEASQVSFFLRNWGQLWSKFVSVELQVLNNQEPIDPQLLTGWIPIDSNISPLELTLLTWGSYAGDINSGEITDAIHSHLNRIITREVDIEIIEDIVALFFEKANPYISLSDLQDHLEKNKQNFSNLTLSNDINSEISSRNPNNPKHEADHISSTILQSLINSGLLISFENDQVGFLHQVLIGYIYSLKIKETTIQLLPNSQNWNGKFICMDYCSNHEQFKEVAEKFFMVSDFPLYSRNIIAGRWLRFLSISSPLRPRILELLSKLLVLPNHSLNFRIQIIMLLMQSKDAGLSHLFRNLSKSFDPDLRQIASLGIAVTKDFKSQNELTHLLSDDNENVRNSACFGLARIGNQEAIDQIGQLLLHSDDSTRRVAAEALATNLDGHGILREACAMDDILIRRAAIYGLAKIDEEWASELIFKIQIEDDQWLVRNAASDVLKEKQLLHKMFPENLPPPSENPWLLKFASKYGIGISPGKSITDLLLLVFKEGTDNEKTYALDYVVKDPVESYFPILFSMLFGDDRIFRELAFQTIWELGSCGIPIPDPIKYGF